MVEYHDSDRGQDPFNFTLFVRCFQILLKRRKKSFLAHGRGYLYKPYFVRGKDSRDFFAFIEFLS